MSLTQKIVEALPEGTRPVRWMTHQISKDSIKHTDLDLVGIAKQSLIRELEGPHLIVTIDDYEFDPRMDDQFIALSYEIAYPLTIVFGCTLGAIPGKLPYIFVKGTKHYKEGLWLERKNLHTPRIHLKSYPGDVLSAETLTAESNGKIEVGIDGKMGEIYEIRS